LSSPIVWELLIVLALILANGFFSGAEIAIIAARRGRLQQLADSGDRAARIALELAGNPNQFLPTVQVGITLVGTFVAAFGGAKFVDAVSEPLNRSGIPFLAERSESIALAVVVLAITFVSLVLGELVPKRLALGNAEQLARVVARPMRLLSIVARPAVWFMGFATEAVLWLLGNRGASAESAVRVEDVEHLIKAGTSEGTFETADPSVALEALRLGERSVRDVMRPRIELEALDVDTPPEEVIGTVAMAGFSRLPVYEEDLDHIIGFVHIKDLFRHQHLGWPIQLRKLLHPALFVPETLPLNRLLELFREKSTQLAVVLDEFGGTEGVVTLEDLMEELVGEIRDEHNRDRQQSMVQREDGTWLVDGRVNILDLTERLGLPAPIQSELRGFSTIAGLILAKLGRLADIGDRVTWHDLQLEVVDIDGQRIDRVLVSPLPPPSP